MRGVGGALLRRDGQQSATQFQLLGAMAIREKAVMSDAVEAVRQGVQQEAPDELVGIERHDLDLAAMTIVLPAERDPAVGHTDKPRIGDGDAMGVAAEIGQHLPGATEGRFGVDDPFDMTDLCQPAAERGGRHQPGEVAKEAQIARVVGGLQVL